MAARFVAAVLAFLILFPNAARADERILDYRSNLRVQSDGSLDVVETIRVRAEGDEIRHGIFRDFPTTRGGSFWNPKLVGFHVLDVRRDGQPEPWTTSGITGGVRVRIGDADRLVDPGEHEYAIHYLTTRQIGYFQTFDELYWNVTGTGWIFPIDSAEATVTLPRSATFGNRTVYTGSLGATGHDAAVVAESPGSITFRTNAPLGSHEGLTISVAFPKGVIAAPTAEARLGWWLSDEGPIAVGIIALLGVLLYYFFAWKWAGRGPLPGTIVPLFSPPDGLTPAAVNYVAHMGSGTRTFSSALIDLGVRGRLRLVEGEKHFFSKPKTTIEKTGGTSPAPAPETAMLDRLFADGGSIEMEQKNHTTFSASQKALTDALQKLYEGDLFVRNWSWSLRGLALMFAAMWITAVALVFAAPFPSAKASIMAGLSILAIAGAILVYKGAIGNSASRMLFKIVAVLAALAGVGFAVGTVVMALGTGRVLPFFIPLLSLPVVLTAFSWMAAPTAKGRAVMDRIAGFKQYLEITEEDRLERMHPPEKTPELFERYLPYAIALEVENAWADKFTGILAGAAAAGHAQTMAWYSGHSDPWRDPGSFASQMGSTLSSTVASASASPSSSGGGSSGGGGGGGGGGGW